MVGRYHTIIAAAEETAFLSDRYTLMPGIGDSATLLLEDLLNAQERQADEEAAFVDSQVNYTLSLVRLRKAMGTLLLTAPADYQPMVSPSSAQLPDWEELDLPMVPRFETSRLETSLHTPAQPASTPEMGASIPRDSSPAAAGNAAGAAAYQNFPSLLPSRLK